MKKQQNINELKNIHYQTQLLESLGWDNSQLDSLFEYLDLEFNADVIKKPGEILNNVEECFGIQTRICLEEYFKKVYMTNNLHLVNPTSVN